MQRVLDWGTTLVFAPVFAMTLLAFEVIQRVAKRFGERPHDYAVAVMCSTLAAAFRLVGTRVEVDRAPEVTAHTPYLIVANHQSLFDIIILGHLFFTNFPKFVSKRELARGIPSVAYNLRHGGNALIDRADGAQAEASIAALGHRVERKGVSAVIFPEGTRARSGLLRVFKPRGTMTLMAAAPATPIVAVTIENSWKLMRWNFLPIPFGIRVLVRIDAPIGRSAGEDREQMIIDLRAHIDHNLAAMRGMDRDHPPTALRKAS